MITRNTDYSIQRLRGLSTDTKPTDVPNGSEFREMDTGKKFLFDAENQTWIDQANPTPSGGNDMFVITLSFDGSETYTVDKTYAEILAAVEDGQLPVVVSSMGEQTRVFYYQGIFENGARFSAIPFVLTNYVEVNVVTVTQNDTVIFSSNTYPRQP